MLRIRWRTRLAAHSAVSRSRSIRARGQYKIDTQRRFEVAWRDLQRYLIDILARGGVDAIAAEELTVLPGVEEVLALLAVRDLAASGQWDAVVVDCAPTAETLRLLALPEALGWYLQKVFPTHRRLARGMRPLAVFLGRGEAIPSDGVFRRCSSSPTSWSRCGRCWPTRH